MNLLFYIRSLCTDRSKKNKILTKDYTRVNNIKYPELYILKTALTLKY